MHALWTVKEQLQICIDLQESSKNQILIKRWKMIFWEKSCSMYYYDSTEFIIIHKDKTKESRIYYGLYYIWTDLQVFTDWIEMKLSFSKNLNAIGCSETELIDEIFNQSFMRKSNFFESWWKSRKISSV